MGDVSAILPPLADNVGQDVSAAPTGAPATQPNALEGPGRQLRVSTKRGSNAARIGRTGERAVSRWAGCKEQGCK